MATNSVRTQSPRKPKTVKKTVALNKHPKAGSPGEQKTKAQSRNAAALKEARQRVRGLKSTVVQLRAQIKAERAEGLPEPPVLRADVARAQAQLEKAQAELSQAKALSRKRKDEIDEWKAWYEKLPDAEKPAGLITLQSEINWRAAELDSNGQRINSLMLAELEAMGAFEKANQKLAAVEAGVHKLPVEKDPRLKSALNELNKAVAKTAKLAPTEE
jgi:chromosome segregation ATPase